MSAPALRPLRVGEILDAGIKVYMRNARTLMGLTALVVVPLQILSAVVLLSTVSDTDALPGGFGATADTTGDSAAALGAQVTLLVTGVIVGLLTTAACVKAVSDVYLGQPTDLRSSLRFAVRRLGSLFWLQALTVIALILGFLLLVIPGIWLFAASSVASQALLVEGVRGRHALMRSVHLVRGRWWPSAAVLLVSTVMASIVGVVLQGLLVALAVAADTASVLLVVVVVSLANAVSAIVTRPFQAAVTTVLYYDLRVRRDGYDVALLAEQLGLDPAVLPATGAGMPAGPESVGQPGGPPFWPPPPGWTPAPAEGQDA